METGQEEKLLREKRQESLSGDMLTMGLQGRNGHGKVSQSMIGQQQKGVPLERLGALLLYIAIYGSKVKALDFVMRINN